jgi:hypothetical protein
LAKSDNFRKKKVYKLQGSWNIICDLAKTI